MLAGGGRLIDAIDVPVYITDAEGRVVHYNEAAVRLWGRRPEVGTDKWGGALPLFYPGGQPMPHDASPMAIALRDDRKVRGQAVMLQRRDGTRLTFMPMPTPLHDATGELIGAVNVLVDVSEHTQAEAARMREVRQDLARRLLEEQAVSQVSALLRTALDLQTVCEAALSQITNLTGSEFGIIAARTGDQARLVASRGLKRQMLARYRRLDQSQKTLLAEALFRGLAAFSPLRQLPATSARAFETLGVNRFAAVPLIVQGSIVGALQVSSKSAGGWTPERRSFLLRIADQVSLPIANALQYEQLQEAYRLRDEGVRAISHEIRTPLTSIKGFAQLAVRQLARGGVSEEQLRDSLNEINEAAERLTNLAQHMLSASSLEEGLSRIHTESCTLSGVIRDAVREFKRQELPVRVRVQRAAAAKVQCDPTLIRQVIWNLLSNAVKYSPQGGEVVIAATASGGQARVCVTDSGPGVPPREQKRLFEKFHRGAGSSAPGRSGLGLGLYVAQQVMEAHQQKIWYEPAEPHGARFCFSLSLAEPATSKRRRQ